jgi:hypothetical protein
MYSSCFVRDINNSKSQRVSRGGSVSIVSDYRLDDRDSITADASVQASSEAHPASYLMDTGGPLPGESTTAAWR